MQRTQIREFFTRLDPRAREVGDGESLLAAGVMDSLTMAELLEFLERTTGVTVTDEELLPDNFETIDAIVHFLEKKGCRQEG